MSAIIKAFVCAGTVVNPVSVVRNLIFPCPSANITLFAIALGNVPSKAPIIVLYDPVVTPDFCFGFNTILKLPEVIDALVIFSINKLLLPVVISLPA